MGAAKKVGIGIGVIFIIIAIIFGLVAYSYTQIHVSLNDVTFHSIDWTSFSWSTLLKLGLNALTGNWLGAAFNLIDGINLNLIFGLSNNGILPVYIPDLSYDLSINGVPVGSGDSTVNLTINPGETRELPVLQNFQKSGLDPAVASIVSADGVINLKVSGTAYFKLLGVSIPVPFESTKQVSIVDEIKKRLSSESQKNQQPQKKTTYISLDTSDFSVTQGSFVKFSGRLTDSSGNRISNAAIYLKDEDTGSGDDLIARVYTNSNGQFSYNWSAEPMDLFDDIVEVYAIFEGSSNFQKARSGQLNIIVQEKVYLQPQTQPQTPSQPQILFKQTSISLNIPYISVNKGDVLPISGRLIDSDGKGVQGATIYIKDEDTGSGDDVMAIVKTDSSGRFSVQWITKKMDPFDSVVEIYAVFEGSSNFGNARSVQINVRVN